MAPTQIAAMEQLEELCRRAYAQYGVQALWSFREIEHPSPGHARVIARALRVEGDMKARFLAEEIEKACLAAE